MRNYDLDQIQWPDTPFDLKESLILAGKRGSEAHNTYIPPEDETGTDDKDVMGICIPPTSYYLGLKTWEHAESIKGVWDVVLYDVRKFVNLLVKQNPNVLCMLYLRPEDYLYLSEAGERLIANRSLFKSKQLFYDSFIGYTKGQFYRMSHHQADPKRGFMGAKRKALVEKYGYNSKNAAHAYRLLAMGIEFLQNGEMQVFRTQDAELIKDIKRGKWTLQQINECVDEGFKKAEEAFKISKLPETIDLEAVDNLLVGLHK